MARGILLGLFLFFCSCSLPTQKEELRVVYFSGSPAELANPQYPHLKLVYNSPFQVTLKWQKERPDTFIRYASSELIIDCSHGTPVQAEDRSIEIKNLEANTMYKAIICSKEKEQGFEFEFRSGTYNMMTLQQWCEYDSKSKGLQNAFHLLMRLKKINHCSSLYDRPLPAAIDANGAGKEIDLYPISAFASDIETMRLSEYRLISPEHFSRFTGLKYLFLTEVLSPQLEFLQHLPNLEVFSMTQVAHPLVIRDEFDFMPNLRHLALASNSLVTFDRSALNGTQLKRLTVSRGYFPDMDFLSNQMALESLSLIDSELLDLDSIPSFDHLRQLDVSKNALSELPSFDWMTNLSDMNISHNPITSTQNFLQFVALEALNISHTQIDDVESLKPLEDRGLIEFRFESTPAHQADYCPFDNQEICFGPAE